MDPYLLVIKQWLLVDTQALGKLTEENNPIHVDKIKRSQYKL